MEKRYYIGTSKPTESVKQLRNIKQKLTDIGIIDESTPDDMIPKAIEDGLKESGEAVENIKDVKQALVDKGVATEDTPNSELDDAINNIETAETWETINLDSKKKVFTKPFDYIFYHSNGIDAYGSYSSSSNAGIWHWNVMTGAVTKIYANSYRWQYFFEDSKGNVYVSSDSVSNSGIVYLNGNSAEQIYTSGFSWSNFFERQSGVIVSKTPQPNGQDFLLIDFNQNVYLVKE